MAIITEPSPFDANEYGWWCPHCGYCVRSMHIVFDSEDDPEPPLSDECKECGLPEVSQEWIDANV